MRARAPWAFANATVKQPTMARRTGGVAPAMTIGDSAPSRPESTSFTVVCSAAVSACSMLLSTCGAWRVLESAETTRAAAGWRTAAAAAAGAGRAGSDTEH